MAITHEQRFPESLGAGVETPSGAVVYGVPSQPQVAIVPSRPAAERDADMARARERCPRCTELPDEVVQAVVAALRAAAREGRLR
jgi:hypothetical protein